MKIFKSFFVLLILLALSSIQVYSQDENIYSDRKIFCSMAGSGDPWSAFTKPRRTIMLALHDGLNIEDLSKEFNLSERQINNELNELKKSSLIRQLNNNFVPDIFIADLTETKIVYSHSKTTGQKLAALLLKEWDQLEHFYAKLSLSKSYSLENMGFMLVGSRILDMGVLGELVKDKSLLTIAPSRPSPGRPDSKYYFWMVEGDREHLGKYGQEDTDLSWPNWHLLNFGQNYVNEQFNKERKNFEDKSAELIKLYIKASPEFLANKLNVPYLNKEDSKTWEETSKLISIKLFKLLKEEKQDFQNFYNTLKASQYTNNSFGEFFCWYYHLAFSWAIDALEKNGAIIIPKEKFSALVMYREGPEGLLSK